MTGEGRKLTRVVRTCSAYPSQWDARTADGQYLYHGMHTLRRFYASVLLDAGESVKAVSECLGHRDPGFTLRTYTHLMPSSGKRTRAAVDGVFTDEDSIHDGPDTAQEGT